MAIDLFGAAISLVIFLYLILGENRKIRQNRLFSYIVLCNISILVLDAASWSLDGVPGPRNAVITRIVSFLGYVFMYLIIGAFTGYMKAYLESKWAVCKPLMMAALGLCAFSVLTVALSQFGGLYYYIEETNLYHRGSLYWLSQVLVFAALLLNIAIVMIYRKALNRKELISFLSYLLLPILFNILHIWYYDVSWSCVATTLAVVVIYAGIQSEQTKQLAAQALELSESKIAVMLSQIQPHFLYNTLNTIGDMCVTDPELAQETVFEFSDYLRANMESLSSPSFIRFDKELSHVETYLALEKKRFGEQLSIQYDIGARSFWLPPLTVQPLVENAVLHGITERGSGGTVMVKTEETADGVKITVADDGVGFEPATPPNDGKTHVGLDSVRKRLATLCGGSLTVESTPGQGTTVTIQLPKKGVL